MRVRADLAVLLALVAAAGLAAGAAGKTHPKPGARCTKAGARVGWPKGGTLVCTSAHGKMIWRMRREGPGGGTASGGTGGSGATSGTCAAGKPTVVNDVRVCSHGSQSQPDDCRATANSGNRIDQAFAIDPTDPNVLWLGVELHGVFKSTDGGATWKLSSKGLIGYPRRDDPSVPCVQELANIVVDPSDPNHLLLSRTDNPGTLSGYFSENAGVFETRDGGATWRQSYDNPTMNTYVRYGLAFGNSSTWYSGSYNQGPDTGGAAPNTVGVIYKTSDGGSTWKELPTGLVPSVGVQALFPKPGDPNTVLAFTFARPTGQQTFTEGLGTIVTTDGGQTWTKIENNLPAAEKAPEDVDVAATNFAHVFVVSFQSNGYSSSDGGRTFVTSTGTDGLTIARYEPHDPGGNALLGSDYSGGMFASSDNGVTWRRISSIPAGSAGATPRVSVIRWDPSSGTTVYAGGVYEGSAARVPFLFRSRDGGATWQSVLDPATLKP